MTKLLDPHFKRDLVKLACLAMVAAAAVGMFFLTPALCTPTCLSLIATMLLSPLVASLERRGHPRALSILIIFGTLGVALVWGTVAALHSAMGEFDSLKSQAPQYLAILVERLRAFEQTIHTRFPFARSMNLTDSVVLWGKDSAAWFMTNAPKLAGDAFTTMFIGPILTFVLLNDGRAIRRQFFHLVPNRWFEMAFSVTNGILGSLSDYLQAKLVEAFLVGIMTWLGLWLIGAPYAVVLAVIAGVTNILPYVGPVIGVVPAIALIGLDPAHAHLMIPMLAVYGVANVIDNVVIFPVVVAKLVDLHPLILIAVVTVGQTYYGLIGMLISIPIATAIKVVVSEIYSAVYEVRGPRRTVVGAGDYLNALIKGD